MNDSFLTEVELDRSAVLFRKNSDGAIMLEVNRVLQKGMRILIDGPFEYLNPYNNQKVRLIRFKTNHSSHEDLNSLQSGLFLIESLFSFSRVENRT